jgi:hypothetical protein
MFVAFQMNGLNCRKYPPGDFLGAGHHGALVILGVDAQLLADLV